MARAKATAATAGPGGRWRALRQAVREANQLGAEFRIVGDSVETEGHIPASLREALPSDMLRDYFGAERDDLDEIEFLDAFGVKSVLVTDLAGAESAMAELAGADPVAIDIETWPRGARPTPIKINKDGCVSANQPTRDTACLSPHLADIATMQLYAGGSCCFVLRDAALRHVLDFPWLREQRLLAHNASFEISFIRYHSKPPKGVKAKFPFECSQQAAGLLYGTYRRGLDDVSLAILGVKPPKKLQASCWAAPRLSVGQAAYAAVDSIITWHIWQEMRPDLEDRGRLAAYELQRAVIPAVVDMQLRGLGFDSVEHARQTETWADELTEARREYLKLTGEPAPSNDPEVRIWLEKTAGHQLENWPRTATGGLSVQRKHLKRLILAEISTAKRVLAIKAKQDLLKIFGPKLREFTNPVTGRIHCSYNNAASKAGRFTASKPNLQQLPSAKAPEFKKAIVPAPSNVLVGGDWSQIEMRAAAWISGDAALTRVYEEERDLHTETAALIAGVPVAEVTKEMRQAAKAVNFGSIYGVGARTLAENAFDAYGVDLTEAEARAALDRFFSTYSTLRNWMYQQANLCQARGYVEIGVGRVVQAEWEPGGRLSFPQCCNLPVQGAAADAMLRALPMVYRRLRGLRGGLVATVHDEILIEIAEADAEFARAILEEAMIEAFSESFPGAPTGKLVEVKIGTNWAEVKA